MKVSSLSRLSGAIVLACAVGVAALAIAEDFNPIAARRALMKSDGQSSGLLFKMAKGDVPFDAARAVEAAIAVSNAGHTFATEFDKYFPDSSKSGDTHAAPALWDNKDDVKKIFLALEADAKAIAEAAPKGADAFKAAFGPLGGDCKSCHEKYKTQ